MSKWSSAFRDSRWQQKRLEVMERDKWTCCSCGANGEGVSLNVHHIYYENGKAPWEYPNDLLITWCEECHGRRHEIQQDILLSLSRASCADLTSIYFCLVEAGRMVVDLGDALLRIGTDGAVLLVTKTALATVHIYDDGGQL